MNTGIPNKEVTIPGGKTMEGNTKVEIVSAINVIKPPIKKLWIRTYFELNRS